MPRPITKADIKRWRNHPYLTFRVTHCAVLGITIKRNGHPYWAYATRANNLPHWVLKGTLQKRKRMGRPKKRYKQIMKEPDFGLEEMELAEAIMNGG